MPQGGAPKGPENHMSGISTTARRQNHTTEIVSTLPETEVSAFSEKLSPEKSSENGFRGINRGKCNIQSNS